MKTILLILAIIFTSHSSHAQLEALSQKDRTLILQALDKQQSAWNKGDIDAFMQSYWKSEKLVFNGSYGPIFGWENTKQRYLKGYPDTISMGKLKFKVITLDKIADGLAQMIGSFHLKRSIGDLNGYFTLNWKKFDHGWLIISDHTSGSN